MWVVCIFYLASTTLTALIFYAVLSESIPLPEPTKALYASLRPIDYAVMCLSAALNVAGATALFMLRRIAPWLLLAALVIGWLKYMIFPAPGASIGNIGLSQIVGLVLSVVIISYTFRLRMRRVLS